MKMKLSDLYCIRIHFMVMFLKIFIYDTNRVVALDFIFNLFFLELILNLYVIRYVSRLTTYLLKEKVQKSCKNVLNLSQDAQLIWLMNNESDDIINLFSRYSYDCFKLR